jgi:plastocyanin
MVGLALALALFPSPAMAAQGSVNVSVKGFAFNPATITVVIGVNNTVSWMNNDQVTHTLTADAGAFDDRLAPGATFNFTFNTPGTYTYHCSIHTYMKGSVVVLAGPSSSTTASSSTSTSSTITTSSLTSTSTSMTQSSSTASPSSSQSTSSETSTSASGNGIPEFPFQTVAAVAVTALVLASYLVVRQKQRTPLGRQP